MNPAKYNLPDIRRGDTWASRNIATITDSTGAPVSISSARMQIRDKHTGDLIHSWSSSLGSITIAINVITLSRIEIAESSLFPVGNQHDYDLEVTTSTGDVWTILEGKVNIIGDISR